MIHIIKVKCPTCLNLSLEVDDNLKFNYINQTIDLYDNIDIYQRRHFIENVEIKSHDKLNEVFKDLVLKTVNLFTWYTKIGIKGLVIEIDQNKTLPSLNHIENILAGILVGLNYYYKTNLTNKEICNLASLISLNTLYFIQGGTCFLDTTNNKVSKIKNTPYESFLVIDPSLNILEKDVLNDINLIGNKKNKISFPGLENDLLDNMPVVVKDINNFLNNYKNVVHQVSGITPITFVANNSFIDANIPIHLKREFPNIKVYTYKKTNGIKTIGRYEN